ncbi:MAG: hypothetical protein KatS3mg016_1197 [Fimbriimonadales bacterium]|nr:MAG: hypothetical protein KatS3mg016_1197 [Fimbriimonadales bacterium]GIV07843.1 MAG: hypothetical protein KatS3mg017_1045 [Fimbriimonadales bacterium]
MNKTLIYVLIAVVVLAVGVFLWQSMSSPPSNFVDIDANGPRPSEPPPGTVSGPGGGAYSVPQQPASGLPAPPGKGGR